MSKKREAVQVVWVQGLSRFHFRALAPQAERGRGSGTGEWLLPVVGGAGAEVDG